MISDNSKECYWHAMPIKDIFDVLKTSSAGLSEEEVAHRLKKSDEIDYLLQNDDPK
jgi:hypothetical protein